MAITKVHEKTIGVASLVIIATLFLGFFYYLITDQSRHVNELLERQRASCEANNINPGDIVEHLSDGSRAVVTACLRGGLLYQVNFSDGNRNWQPIEFRKIEE